MCAITNRDAPPVTLTVLMDNTAAPGLAGEHGLALWIETPQGLIVCCGCCHAGLINTLHYIGRLAGTPCIAAIIGGLHLLHADAARMAATMAALSAWAPPVHVLIVSS